MVRCLPLALAAERRDRDGRTQIDLTTFREEDIIAGRN